MNHDKKRNSKKKNKRHKRKKHPQMSTYKMIAVSPFGGRSKKWRKMAEMVAEAHFARTTLELGASLDPKLLSLRILHL